MNKIISENIDEIKLLCESHNVERLFAFGSACTDTFNEASDVDFLVSFKKIRNLQNMPIIILTCHLN
ncbi:MAG: nucleotidyltransferase domain-containing protein [Victivallales bacterium]|nr:nucleotidyltransferase domain-containing protein [Victivallales bacterium]